MCGISVMCEMCVHVQLCMECASNVWCTRLCTLHMLCPASHVHMCFTHWCMAQGLRAFMHAGSARVGESQIT